MLEGQQLKAAMLDERNVPTGIVETEVRRRYYDVSRTITQSTTNDPGSEDDASYQEERIFDAIQRRSPKVIVTNDALANSGQILYVRVSHDPNTFSPETPIYATEKKTYYNIYTIRLRSPTQGLPFRVTEYNIRT